MADQDGLRFLFDIQDKITAKLAKIEAKSVASAKKINSAFTKASKAQEANAAKVIHTEKLRGIAVESATAKATAARTKETTQGKILAQRLSAAQSNEARKAANFRIAAAKRAEASSTKAERAIAAASKARARVAIKAEKDHERALKVRAREQEKTAAASVAIARKSAFALAALGAALAAVSVKLIAFGSDAEETENVTGLAFGSMKGAAEKWAASFAASTGSSRFESIELVSDLGLIVKGMGFTEEASLGMSSRMVELAADMASAKNVPLDVALDKIRAGLIGESEPLRTMGVLLSEVRVKEEAYASGLAKTGTELTNTQKVQARMNIILADSAAMHGDLINTQGSVANQWRAIKNRVFDAATVMGKKLLPAASKVLGVLGEWAKKGADLITWLTKSEKRMKVFGAILAGVVVAGLGLAAAALWALVPAITAATGGINLIIPAIAVGVGALVAGWVLFGDTIKDFLRKVWGKMLDKIGSGLQKLSKFVGIFNDDWADAMASAGEGLQETAAEMGKTEKATEKLTKEQKAASKEQVKAEKVLEKLTKEQIKAAKAAEDSATAVQDLADSWTGATVKSDKFLKAFKKLTPEQKKNDRIMDKVLDKYDELREILGPFNEELEKQWRATRRLNPELDAQRRETEKLEKAAKKLAEKALKELNKEQEKLKKVGEELNERLETQRRRLLGLPTEAAIRSFAELTRTWEGLNEAEKAVATDKYSAALRDAAKAGHELNDAQVELATSAGANWAGSFFDTISKAFEGGGGYMGGLKSLASKAFGQMFSKVGGGAGGGFTDALSKIFSGEGFLGKIGAAGSKIGDQLGKFLSLGLNAVPIIGPFLAAFSPLIMKAIRKWGGKIWTVWKDVWTLGLHRLIGGPSGAEKAGRKTAHEFRQGVIAGLSETQTTEVEMSWAQGWDSSVIIAVRDALVATGMEYDAARAAGGRWYDALHAAEKQGPEAVQRVIDDIQAILDAGAAATGEAAALEAERRNALLDALAEEQSARMASLKATQVAELSSLKATQTAMLSELKTAQATQLSELKAAQQRELDALASARNAQLSVVESAIQRELEDERIAAQLKIDLRKAGGDQEAIDAANARAAEATANLLERDELNDLMAEAEARVRARYKDELDTINEHWDEKESILVTRHGIELAGMELSHGLELDEINSFHELELSKMEQSHADQLAEMELFHAAQLAILVASFAAMDAVPSPRDRTVTVTTVNVTEPNPNPGGYPGDPRYPGYPGRQHGGPVSAGQRYMVGEGGPEMFVPSQSGRIEPNGSSGGAVDPRILARAIKDALQDTSVNVDGRQLGRLTIRHQPLAVAELGGRR